MQIEKNYLTDVEAAQVLGLSKQTLRNWRFNRRGPAYHRAGRAIRYAKADLQSYMQARRIDHDRA